MNRSAPSIFYRRFDFFVLLLAGVTSDFALKRATFIAPWYIFQYGAAFFWAIALYALLGLLLPRLAARKLALLAALAVLVIELSRLLHTPTLDAFRMTFTGRLLFGRFFDPLDLAVCWLAVAAMGLFDRFILPSRVEGQELASSASKQDAPLSSTLDRSAPFYRRFDCFVLLLAGVTSDLVLKRATFILPWYLFQYGAAAFWAIALYAFLGLLFTRLTPRQLTLFAALAAALVEFSRLLHTPAFDAFRITLAGRLLLGRFFDPLDLAICWLAIIAIALFDRFVLHPRYP